jgi:hypothetical protein
MKVIPTEDLYAVLGVPTDADLATIRRAYRKLLRQYHPDGRPERERDQAHEETVTLSLAFEYLSDPIKRRDYDESRRHAPNGHAPGAAAPPREPPPPPPPPRVVVVTPETIDFGTVYIGGEPVPGVVSLRFADGSRIADARVRNMFGDCWYTAATVFQNVPTVDIRVFGVASSSNETMGLHVDQLRIQVDEVTVCVQLHVTVAAAPPAPEPVPVVTPPRRPSRAALGRWAALILLVAVIAGVLVHVSGQSQHQAAASRLTPQRAAAGAPPSKYCSVASSGGQVLSYYLTKPGVAKQAAAGKDPIWSVMTPTSGDDYVTWWTPAFPYWERANLYDGFFDDAGTRHSKFDYAEVLAYADVPWLPLPEVFQRYPEVNASVEAVQRKLFIQDWSEELGSPPCN